MNGQRSTLAPAAAVTELLHGATAPLTVGEISLRLGLAYRTTGYVLARAVGEGRIERIDGGRFRLTPVAAVVATCGRELLEVVAACEADWSFDDRLAALARASTAAS